MTEMKRGKIGRRVERQNEYKREERRKSKGREGMKGYLTMPFFPIQICILISLVTSGREVTNPRPRPAGSGLRALPGQDVFGTDVLLFSL